MSTTDRCVCTASSEHCCRFDILCKCWELKPEDRPTFSEMVDMLQEYWDDEHFYIVRSLSTV